MILTPLNDNVWEIFLSYHDQRNLPHPPKPPCALFVSTDDCSLVAGACIYPTDSMYAFVEHLVSAPGTSPHLAHAAIRFMAQSLRVWAVAAGKVPLVFATPSVGRLLQRCGMVSCDNRKMLLTFPMVVQGPTPGIEGRKRMQTASQLDAMVRDEVLRTMREPVTEETAEDVEEGFDIV